MSLEETGFTPDNLNIYLKELAKEYRKLSKDKIHAEIILVGGAAVMANYGFRDVTFDIDAIFRASAAMKEAIQKVGNKYNLPYDDIIIFKIEYKSPEFKIRISPILARSMPSPKIAPK